MDVRSDGLMKHKAFNRPFARLASPKMAWRLGCGGAAALPVRIVSSHRSPASAGEPISEKTLHERSDRIHIQRAVAVFVENLFSAIDVLGREADTQDITVTVRGGCLAATDIHRSPSRRLIERA